MNIHCNIHWKDWCWSWNPGTLATWYEELTHWKRPWSGERLKTGGEGDDRGWDGWIASLTLWTWVWLNSQSWRWTGRPGVLQSMGSQRTGHDWVTELNWGRVRVDILALFLILEGRHSVFHYYVSCQFSLVAQSCPTLCNPMDYSTPGFPVHHQLRELTQTHVHWVNDAIQPSHPLSSPSPSTFNLSQHQDLFQWVSSSHQVAKVLEFQLQDQSFQWMFRTDFL